VKTQEKSLGELLRRAGKVTDRQVQEALQEQKKTREPIGRILVRLGFVREADILGALEGLLALTFRTGEEFFGVETLWVSEVLRYVPWQPRLPVNPLWPGTLNLRNAVLPVLSFRGLLGLEELSDPKDTWYAVLKAKHGLFVLWMDEVREVKRFGIDQIEPLPPHFFGKKSDLYYCLGKIGSDLYSMINPEKLAAEKV